jgi:hypothetical protein
MKEKETVARPKKAAQEKKPPTHGRKFGNRPSYVIPVWNGILEHCQNIGPAIWEFLWCIDRITQEDENGIGWCLGKTPIDAKDVARDLKRHRNTTYKNLEGLTTKNYLVRVRTPRGYVTGVRNSKKFGVFRRDNQTGSDSQESVNQNAPTPEVSAENQGVHNTLISTQSDSEKTPIHPGSDSQETVIHNAQSDSQESVNQTGSDSQESVNHSFVESDSQKTVIRRDSAKRHSKKTTSNSKSLASDGLDNVRTWARAQILQQARVPILNEHAYVKTVLPDFFSRLDSEIENWLTRKLADYVFGECLEKFPLSPIGYREMTNYLEYLLDANGLPVPNDAQLTDRILANVERRLGDRINACELGFAASPKFIAEKRDKGFIDAGHSMEFRMLICGYLSRRAA